MYSLPSIELYMEGLFPFLRNGTFNMKIWFFFGENNKSIRLASTKTILIAITNPQDRFLKLFQVQ